MLRMSVTFEVSHPETSPLKMVARSNLHSDEPAKGTGECVKLTRCPFVSRSTCPTSKGRH